MSEAERIDLVDRAPLTEKQQNVYESIMQYQRVNGYAPTIREICKMVGVTARDGRKKPETQWKEPISVLI